MAGVHAGRYFPDYLPPSMFQLLQRQKRGEIVTVDSFVNSLEGTPCTADVRCPLCYIDAGEETPEHFYDPENPGEPLTCKNDAFRDQTTWVNVSCCQQPFHRGCLVNMWLDPSRMNADWDMPLPLLCALCRRKILDAENDRKEADRYFRMSRACKAFMSKPLVYQGQELPPGHELDGEKLAMIIGMCFIAELEGGNITATRLLSKKIATAVQLHFIDLDGEPSYCRGQIFGDMIDTVNDVLLAEFGKVVGDARKTGELDEELYKLYTKALRTSLDAYQGSVWYLHRLSKGTQGA